LIDAKIGSRGLTVRLPKRRSKMSSTKTTKRIELGRASRATRGSIGPHMETQGLWTKTELSDR
jgi:hypothetical protein